MRVTKKNTEKSFSTFGAVVFPQFAGQGGCLYVGFKYRWGFRNRTEFYEGILFPTSLHSHEYFLNRIFMFSLNHSFCDFRIIMGLLIHDASKLKNRRARAEGVFYSLFTDCPQGFAQNPGSGTLRFFFDFNNGEFPRETGFLWSPICHPNVRNVSVMPQLYFPPYVPISTSACSAS